MKNVVAASQAVRFAGRAASSDITREGLCVVRLEPGRAWATDGHRAYVIYTEAAANECGAYSADGVKCDTECTPPPIDQVVPRPNTRIAATLTQDALAEMRNVLAVMNQRATALLYLNDQRSYVELTEFVSEARKKKSTKTIVAANVRIPIEAPIVPKAFGINLEYLLDAIQAVGCSGDVKLRQDSELDPVRIDGEFGYAVVMPVRI